LLDEPLSALDRKMREAMQIELKSLQHSVGITFIFVTHDQEEALSMSDRVAVLASGKVQQLASPREIYDEPQNEFVANFVGTSNIFKGKVIAKEGRTLTLKTANGRELAVASDRFGVGDNACAVLRPEHLKLSGETRDRAIKGTVTQSVFVGSEMHLHVDVGLGRTAVVRHRHNKGSTEAAYEPGADVTLYYTPEAAHVIECKGA
jgi:spermidine/putrescine transport system ATP-binding protein